MSVNIKNAEAERLVRELTAVTGEGVTEAVTAAVRERLERIAHQAQTTSEQRAARLRAIAHDAAARWADALRAADHGDLLYDERGLPR